MGVFINNLSVYARNAIEILFYKLKLSIHETIKTIGRSPSTISRELKRNCRDDSYNFKITQTKYQKEINQMILHKVQRFHIEIPKNLRQENLWHLKSMYILKTNFLEIKMISKDKYLIE